MSHYHVIDASSTEQAEVPARIRPGHGPELPGSVVRRRAMIAIVMPWVLLVVAGVLEIVWAFTMKLSEGFTRPRATVVTLLAMVASFALLSMSMRTLPLGTAYTVWTGIGAVGAFVVGIVALGEPANLPRVVAAVLIVSGLVLMKVSSPG